MNLELLLPGETLEAGEDPLRVNGFRCVDERHSSSAFGFTGAGAADDAVAGSRAAATVSGTVSTSSERIGRRVALRLLDDEEAKAAAR
jgi:hypothetical protein